LAGDNVGGQPNRGWEHHNEAARRLADRALGRTWWFPVDGPWLNAEMTSCLPGRTGSSPVKHRRNTATDGWTKQWTKRGDLPNSVQVLT